MKDCSGVAFPNLWVAGEDPEIHYLGDTSPSPHLTQSSYEKSLMDIQTNELSKGEKEK
jgi:hypothetical protein